MKRLMLAAALGGVVAFGWSMAAWAQEQGPMRKLGRGAANIAYGIWEVPIKIIEVKEMDGAVAASTLGVVKGLAAAFQRTFVGVYELLTFPFPQPTGTYGPIIEPEFLGRQ